jgi:hypothetical protein
MDESVHDSFDGPYRLFLAGLGRFIVLEADVTFFLIGKDVGLVGPLEKVHEILLVEGQTHCSTYLILSPKQV